MPEELTDAEQPQEEPKPQKKKRGRPKGSKNKKKKAKTEEGIVPVNMPEEPPKEHNVEVRPEMLETIVKELGAISKRLDSLENTPAGPRQLDAQITGPQVDRNPAERDGQRRAAIRARRAQNGRVDEIQMPSGAVSTVGNRQKRATRGYIMNRAQ